MSYTPEYEYSGERFRRGPRTSAQWWQWQGGGWKFISSDSPAVAILNALHPPEGFGSTDVSNGCTFEPTHRHGAVGFQVTHPDGSVEYLMLNPTDQSDEEFPNCFVYHGTTGDPAQDEACTHFTFFREDN